MADLIEPEDTAKEPEKAFVYSEPPVFAYANEIDEIRARTQAASAVAKTAGGGHAQPAAQVAAEPTAAELGNGKFSDNPKSIFYEAFNNKHQEFIQHFIEGHMGEVNIVARIAALELNPGMNQEALQHLLKAVLAGMSYLAYKQGEHDHGGE